MSLTAELGKCNGYLAFHFYLLFFLYTSKTSSFSAGSCEFQQVQGKFEA
jgi:hypothetical protein